jgi:GNAT superfamily N-acetyltransferase
VPVVIREYEQDDLDECRRLYAQLVEYNWWIYDDPSIGGADSGAGFDSYLATPERVMTWVAVEGDRLVGMTGLFWEGEESTIEPVIVDHDSRTRGIGRRLVEAAIEESRRRGASDVNLTPVARNVAAIRAFHQLGFQTLGHIQMFMSLDRDDSYWRPGIELHERHFDH